MTTTTIIIGGGVIGLSTAYHLAQRQAGRVILLEKGAIGDGSSRRAAGIITGLLWSETGVCVRKLSLARYGELSEELAGYRFQHVGCLNLFDPAAWPERQALLPLYDRCDVRYEIMTAAEIHERWPELTPNPDSIGLYDPLGGYSEPDEYLPALAQACRAAGVEIREQTPVPGFLARGGTISGVQTSAGPIEADAVVCTTHIWLPHLLATLERPLPVKAFVHQRYVTEPMPSAINIPAVNANPHGGYLRPAAGNRLLAGAETGWREEFRPPSADFVMSSLTVPASVPVELRTSLTPLLPRLPTLPWSEERVGLIAFSLDGEPILGPVVAWPGLYLGCAFHSGGFAYNPAAGILLADLVADGRARLDVSAFAPDRFDLTAVNEYLASTVIQDQAVRRRH